MSQEHTQRVICKGSWRLGSACGTCDKCKQEAVDMMPEMLRYNKKLEDIKEIMPGGIYGPSDALKLAVFNEIRSILRRKEA